MSNTGTFRDHRLKTGENTYQLWVLIHILLHGNSALLFALFGNLVPGDSTSPWPFPQLDKAAKLSKRHYLSYMDQYDCMAWDMGRPDRYDGSAIKVYKPDPFLKRIISYNEFRDVLEEGKGRLWVVTTPN